jgi:membrane-bound lytic murein transglycosylase D
MEKLRNILTILITIFLLNSCSSTKIARTFGDGSKEDNEEKVEKLIEHVNLDNGRASDIIENKKRAKKHKIPREINESVKKWLHYFTVKNRGWFQRALKRSEKYEAHMKNILINYGVPEELFYLALIESAFVIRSRSIAGAVGPWQFMPGTARLYGLKVYRSYDERKSPYKATAAAAAYLRDLYNIYGSWYLAMASYNAGEFRIRRAIIKHKERDFWALAEKKALPRETMNYVPKYIAATIVAENPEKYGFTYNGPRKGTKEVGQEIQEILASSQYDRGVTSKRPSTVYKVIRGDNLSRIAKKKRVSLATIKRCNPKLRRSNRIYPGQRIMLKCSKKVKRKSIAKGEKRYNKNTGIYLVRSGDNLWKISKRYKVSINNIKKCNPTLYRHHIFPGQKIHLTCSGKQADPKKSKKVIYTVRKGDNLWSIAQKYDISISELTSWNNLSTRNKIFPGRKLKIYNPASPSANTLAPKTPAPTVKETGDNKYIVKAGDNLWDISKNTNVPIAKIKQCNPELYKNKIYPGDTLKLKCSNTIFYTVKRGDTLWGIAKKYNVSVNKITKWNKLKNRQDIIAGKKLKIYRN